MRTTVTVVAGFLIGLATASHGVSADVCTTAKNLVQNCGFETGDFSGWTLSGTDSAAFDNGIFYGITNSGTYSGSYSAYFGAVGGNIVLSQTLTGLIPTDIYTITIELSNDTSPDTGYVNDFILGLGNQSNTVVSQAPAGGYTQYTAVLGAFSTSAVLSLSSRNDAGYWYLDSIQVVQTGTPEPATVGLFGLTLAALASIRYLRRAAS